MKRFKCGHPISDSNSLVKYKANRERLWGTGWYRSCRQCAGSGTHGKTNKEQRRVENALQYWGPRHEHYRTRNRGRKPPDHLVYLMYQQLYHLVVKEQGPVCRKSRLTPELLALMQKRKERREWYEKRKVMALALIKSIRGPSQKSGNLPKGGVEPGISISLPKTSGRSVK